MLGKRLVDRSDKLDRSGYRQRQWVDGELLVPAWRKTVIYGGEIAAVLYSTAEGVLSVDGGIDPPIGIFGAMFNLFNWRQLVIRYAATCTSPAYAENCCILV